MLRMAQTLKKSTCKTKNFAYYVQMATSANPVGHEMTIQSLLRRGKKKQPSVSHQALEEQVHVEPAPEQPLEQPSLLDVVSDEELASEEVNAFQRELQSNVMNSALPESHRNESDARSGVSNGSGQSFGEKLAASVTGEFLADNNARPWWDVQIGLRLIP